MNYKSGYIVLFQAITKAVMVLSHGCDETAMIEAKKLLIQAQQQTEKAYMEGV